MSTTKLAGEFINQYKIWRNGKITTYFPLAKTTLVNVENFLSNDKYYTIKSKSDELLANVLNYYQTDLGLKAMGIERPTINQELSEFVLDEKSRGIYVKYAKLVLLKSLCDKQIKDIKKTCIPCKVKKEPVEKDLQEVTSNTTVTQHSMMMTFISIKNYASELIPYIANADKIIIDIKKKFKDQAYKDKWIQDTITIQKEHILDENYDNLRFNDLKFKLDLLDPTFALSNEIVGNLYSAMLAYYSVTSLKDTPLVRQIFQASFQQKIKELEQTGGEWINYINTLRVLYGPSLIAFYNKLTQAMFHHGLSGSSHPFSAKHVFSLNDGKLFKTLLAGVPRNDGFAKRKEIFAKLLGDKKFYSLANGLLICAQVSSMIYGFTHWNNLSTFQKSLFIGTSTLSIIDILNTGVNNKIFFKIGEKIIEWVRITNHTKIAKALGKFCTYFSKSILFISKYITPIFLVISICITACDLFFSIKAKKWGMVALNVVELGVSVAYLGIAIYSIFVATAWAGPVCLVLTAILIAAVVMKMIWGFFELLLQGDPDNNFINSVEPIYRYTDQELSVFYIQNCVKYNNNTLLPFAKFMLKVYNAENYDAVISSLNTKTIVV